MKRTDNRKVYQPKYYNLFARYKQTPSIQNIFSKRLIPSNRHYVYTFTTNLMRQTEENPAVHSNRVSS